MNNKKAFTLTETVIAVAIMGLIIITVLGVFVTGNNAIKKGRSVIVATNIAEKKTFRNKKSFCKISKLGNSSTHEPHQLAQKLTNIVLPSN